jgi:8-oxo-dGTP pyrophosphatase MutT (NUDIX family)
MTKNQVCECCWAHWIKKKAVANAGVVVFNSNNEALLLQRNKKEWVIPSGAIDVRETPEAAAQRELKEETSINIEIFESDFVIVETFKDVKDGKGRKKTDITVTFKAKYLKEKHGEILIDKKHDKIRDYCWIARDDFTSKNMNTGTMNQLIKAYEMIMGKSA